MLYCIDNVTNITANGPPVELVSVADRLKAVPEKLFCYEQSRDTQLEGVKHGVVFACQAEVF
jgi:hypothetical protein